MKEIAGWILLVSAALCWGCVNRHTGPSSHEGDGLLESRQLSNKSCVLADTWPTVLFPDLQMDQITFDRIRRRYREDATKLGCGDRYPSILAGQCNEGKVLFLKLSEGYGWRILYFSAADQKIIGGAGISDVRDAECDGMAVWREEIECRDYEITDVICGTFQKVGAKGDLAMPLTRGRKANGIVPKK